MVTQPNNIIKFLKIRSSFPNKKPVVLRIMVLGRPLDRRTVLYKYIKFETKVKPLYRKQKIEQRSVYINQ